jgi:SAM-dependent methyltransferase
MKDLFSIKAADYSKFRPGYPPALFDYLASLCPRRECAWDCATGNGQAAAHLSERFQQVIATDLSEKQLLQATPSPKIEYRVARAEDSGITQGTVDLTTVAQALHWFDFQKFYAEVRRVSRPEGAIIGVWSYALASISPGIDERILHFYHQIIGKYWEPERRLVDEGYRTLPFPFTEVKTPAFSMRFEWNFSQLLGYLGTWSAVQTAIKAEGKNPLEEFAPELANAWGAQKEKRVVSWPLNLRVGKV